MRGEGHLGLRKAWLPNQYSITTGQHCSPKAHIKTFGTALLLLYVSGIRNLVQRANPFGARTPGKAKTPKKGAGLLSPKGYRGTQSPGRLGQGSGESTQLGHFNAVDLVCDYMGGGNMCCAYLRIFCAYFGLAPSDIPPGVYFRKGFSFQDKMRGLRSLIPYCPYFSQKKGQETFNVQ